VPLEAQEGAGACHARRGGGVAPSHYDTPSVTVAAIVSL
jgi:hypothetical protein